MIRLALRHLTLSLLALAFSASGPAVQAKDIAPDQTTPERNAIVWAGGCTGTLIGPREVLSVAHCLPRELRAAAPPQADWAACDGLTRQSGIAMTSWEDPMTWYPSATGPDARMTIRFGNAARTTRLTREVVAYALPRCGDLALLRLDLGVPFYVARPMAVMSTPPDNPDLLFGPARLRHAGWGEIEPRTHHRQTGPVDYWSYNACHLIGLPPLRGDGRRIVGGDSGAPLLMQMDGREVQVGVLWGAGALDIAACGDIIPRAPAANGSYTPTFRPAIAGTEATDIGEWLRAMVPEAEHVSPH